MDKYVHVHVYPLFPGDMLGDRQPVGFYVLTGS